MHDTAQKPPVQPACATSPAARFSDAACDEIRQFVRAGGPAESEFDRFSTILTDIWTRVQSGEVNEMALAKVREAFGAALSPATLQGRGLAKKYGYPGDFEIIDAFYRREITAVPYFRRWDEYCHAQPASQALRNRKEYAKAVYRRLNESCAGTGRIAVLNVGCGSARDIREHFDEHPDSRLVFTAVDLDRHAIEHAESMCCDYADRVTFVRRSLQRLRTDARFHLVWSAGLFDYFDDAAFARHLKALLACVAPGGRTIVGNFSPANPSRAYMEICSDWHLHYRDADTLRRLAPHATQGPLIVGVDAEELGINLFLHVRTNSQS